MSAPDYFARKPSYNRTRSSLTPNERPSPSPRTPTFARSLSSQFASSPSSYRVEEEAVVYSIGARSLRAGFPGEPTPRCIQTFGPQTSRRVDDFRAWAPATTSTTTRSFNPAPAPWGKEWELANLHLSKSDLGLVEDKIDRAIRRAHTEHLLLDQRSRRLVLALPTGLSDALIYVILRTVFTSSGLSSISVWSNPLLCTLSAGLRSALVIDIGWEESTVSGVYEYRHVSHKRSVRAAKALTRSVAQTLEEHTGPEGAREHIAFETAEDVMERMAWCRKTQDADDSDYDPTDVVLPIKTAAGLSTTLRVPFASLAEPVERTMFDSSSSLDPEDDHLLPLHVLAYRCLLALPLSVRAMCMSRIVITGGVSNIPGLKPRLLREIRQLVAEHGWDPVMSYGSAAEARRSKALQRQTSTLAVRAKPADQEAPSPTPARDAHDKDDISDKLAREAARRGESVQGVVRGVETLGAWAGASLVANLKIEGTLEVRKEDFMKYGLACFGGRLDAI